MITRGWLPALGLLACAAACRCDPDGGDRAAPASSDTQSSDRRTASGAGATMDPGPPPRSSPIAPSSRHRAPSRGDQGAEPPILAAALEDNEWAGTEPVEARRLVYRVRLWVPPVLGDAPATLPAAAAELFVDVSEERLRARFVGAGWPVDAGSEVRLRADTPGVYVFDARGGRPLTPGALAEWFQGGPPGRDPAVLRVRRPPPQENPGTGGLVCALLAEWSGQEPESVMRRCGDGPPAMFRLGPWRAERMADVPVELPRSALRADQGDPPRPVTESDSRAFMEPALLARLEPKRASGRREEPPGDDAPPEGIRVDNDSSSRIVVTAHGVPVGWVDSGASGHFVGLRPGQHVIAAMRPLGQLAYRPRGVHVPATIRVR